MNSSPPQPLDIFMVKLPVGHAQYWRPCIIVETPLRGIIPILPVSTKDLERFPGNVFRIDSDRPEFAATGLAATSFVVGSEVYSILTSSLGRYIGRLEGQLAKDFQKWIQ